MVDRLIDDLRHLVEEERGDRQAGEARQERAGTPSFWVVDPVARPAEARLIAWELGDDGRYRHAAVGIAGGAAVIRVSSAK